MTKRLGRWTVGLLAAAALCVAPAIAGEMGHGPGHGPMQGMKEALGLTDAQMTQIHDVMRSHMDGPLGEQLRAMEAAHDSLGALIHDPAATDQQVQDQANAVATIGARVAVERHHMVNEMMALLTPEQRTKAAEMHREHRGPRHHPPDDMPGF